MTAISRAYLWLSEGNEINGEILMELIREHRTRHNEMVSLYKRYKGSKDANGVPIHTRKFPIEDVSKVNNKIANDFFTDIVDTKTGYMAGTPVTYQYGEGEQDPTLQDFLKKNSVADLDSESVKMAAIAGYSARLCYVNLDGEAAVINVPPEECIFISDELGISDAPYALRYYTVDYGENEKYTKVEFYDNETVSYWIREENPLSYNDNPFILDTSEPANPQAHLMGSCPLLCFPNNEELLGDCEKVLTLIDGYDKTVSDVNSEIEQFRLAYLAFYGAMPDTETINEFRKTGCIGFPESTDRCEFITKNLSDVVVQNHLTLLEHNIYRFAKSVDTSDINFAANTSGVAMKYKLFGLESKCITTERKFQKALYKQFEVLAGYFAKRGFSIDPWQFKFIFTRNFPLDLQAEAMALSTLSGLVSKKTALGQMSFIDDPQAEVDQMDAENQEYQQAQMELYNAMNTQNLNSQGTNTQGGV